MTCECGSSAVTVELRTGSDGGPAGVVNHCQECGRQWAVEPFKAAGPQRQPGCSPIDAPCRPNIALTRKARQAEPKLTERSLITQAKRQLRVLDKEIARLEKLKRQRAGLARLLDAANAEGPKVVPMRRTETSR